MKISGGCACGRITYEVDGPVLGLNWCYCITCQKNAGAPFIPFADFKHSDISWNKYPDVWESSSFARRWLCNHCGSTLGMYYLLEPENFGIALGTITSSNEEFSVHANHIFLKDKPSWFMVPNDGAPRYERFPGNFEQRLEDFLKEKGMEEKA